jgi:hypothetical protein
LFALIKSLESSKRKRKASEDVSDAEIQAASSLAQLGQKKAVNKVVVSTVRRVPSTFSDDEMAGDLHPRGFSSFLWCDLSLNVRRNCTPGFENEFVDVESFSDDVAEVQKDITDVVAATEAEGTTSQVSALKDRASPEFTEDLERTVQRREDPIENFPVVETREELPEGRDPSPSVAACQGVRPG